MSKGVEIERTGAELGVFFAYRRVNETRRRLGDTIVFLHDDAAPGILV